MAHDLQARYAKLVDEKYRATLTTKDNVIFNTKYEGSPTAGVVKIAVPNEIEVRDYDRENGGSLTASSTSYITVEINEDIYINEKVDYADAAAVPYDVIANKLDDGAYSMALTTDTRGLNVLATEGTKMENTAELTKSTVYDEIVNARTALSKAKVPTKDRWLEVAPDTLALLLKNSEFIKACDLGQKILETGAVGQIAGFNVYEAVNLGEKVAFIAGHPSAATRIEEWAVQPKVQSLDGEKYVGACAIQGRKVLKHKVIKPEGVVVRTIA